MGQLKRLTRWALVAGSLVALSGISATPCAAKKKGIRDQLAIAYWIHFYIPRGRRRAIKRRILEVAD